MNELDDRRQRAREAGLDAWADAVAVPNAEDRVGNALDDAIETATRARIDDEVLAAALDAYDRDMIDSATNVYATICAAFRAAGFEVEQ